MITPRSFSAALMLAVLLASGTARATPNFPGALAGTLGGPTPAYSVCHTCGVTGRGTVNTPWGAALRSRGLAAYDEASLRSAVSQMEAERVDSDGDGIIDVDALRAGSDPNPPTCDTNKDPTIPVYGCVGRLAPSDATPLPLVLLVTVCLVLAAARRRRGVGSAGTLLLLLAASASVAACAPKSGTRLARRADAPPPPQPAALMAPVTPSTLEGDLRAQGLDPLALPRFEELTPRQLRGVMSTFTRSLGLACTDCHDRTDYRTSTRAKRATVQMWNELTRPYRLAEGGAVYCDSCHHGAPVTLDRGDPGTVASFMAEQLVGRLARHDGRDVMCESCHGTPFRPRFVVATATATPGTSEAAAAAGKVRLPTSTRLGLDVRHVPPLDSLDPTTKRRLMKTFSQ